MDWDPAKGPATLTHLRNNPSALARAALVSESVIAGPGLRSAQPERDTCVPAHVPAVAGRDALCA